MDANASGDLRKGSAGPQTVRTPGETKVVGAGVWEVGSSAWPVQTSGGQSRQRVGRGRTLDPPHLPPRLAWNGPRSPCGHRPLPLQSGLSKCSRSPAAAGRSRGQQHRPHAEPSLPHCPLQPPGWQTFSIAHRSCLLQSGLPALGHISPPLLKLTGGHWVLPQNTLLAQAA